MDANEVIQRITQWAERDENIRALLLTSSQVRGETDAMSDFDVELYVTDPTPFLGDPGWQEYLGDVLVRLPPEDAMSDGVSYGRLVIHTDGTKVDYSIRRMELLRRMADEQQFLLIDHLDLGYRILLDRDGVAARLPAPTLSAEIPARPSAKEFAATVEEFFWETSYVAKNLWRGELWPWKYSLESVMKLRLLRRMLEWQVEIEHGWNLRIGVLGRGLRRQLDPETWRELEATFVGARADDNWAALFATIELFRSIAGEVARELSVTYPQALDDGVCAYIAKIRDMPRPSATSSD